MDASTPSVGLRVTAPDASELLSRGSDATESLRATVESLPHSNLLLYEEPIVSGVSRPKTQCQGSTKHDPRELFDG